MTEIWFIPLLGILGLASTIISSKGGLYDNRFKKRWYKKIKLRGWIVTTLGLAIISISIWQSIKVNAENKQEKATQILLRKESDSTIAAEVRSGVDSNRRILFSDLSQALASQQLALDTVTKTVKSLTDSAKTIIVNPEKKIPEVILNEEPFNVQKTDGVYKIKIVIKSLEASSIVSYINTFAEINYIDKTQDTFPYVFLISGKKRLTLGQEYEIYFELNNCKKEIKYINLACWGLYTGINDKKLFFMKEVYMYNFDNKSINTLLPEPKEIFFKKYNITLKY